MTETNRCAGTCVFAVLGLGTLPSAELLLASFAGGVLWLRLGYRLFKAMDQNFAHVI